MQQEVSHIATNDLIKPLASNSELLFSEDYSDLLKKYNLEYQKNECYYSVGKSNWALGWIIDISVILIQIRDLLSLVIPMLIKHSMPFKIIRNSELAEFILDGKMGFKLLGKIVSIYPPTEKQALALAKELISLTNSFRGPKILTDRRLGGVIYTCYGASRTALLTNSKGINETVVYDSDGRVHEDPIQIPFKLSPEIDWPFMSLAPPQTPAKQSILHNKYKPMYILKEDSKGGVRKGLYLEKIWRVKWCVIKEARMNMNVDNHGRTQGDRLRWQYDHF